MTKIMIITLGTGRGVESGIAKSIQVNNPDKLYFIATNESIATIEKVEAALGQKLIYEQPYLLKNPEDVEECWKTATQLVRSLLKEGYTPAQICIDFTSGTKAMSAGAVLAGVGMECGNLSYIGGGKRDSDGRVISGTERVVILTPYEVFIDQRRRLIRDFFNAFQYDACLKLIGEARMKIMAQELHEYRAVEVVAQMLLAQRNIETSRVRIEELPTDWQDDYKGSSELIKLGQEKAFCLLESMGEEIGREYRENKNLRNYLTKRNNSILAHQLEPMTRQIYDELSRETNQLTGRAFLGLHSLKDKSQFPVLELI